MEKASRVMYSIANFFTWLVVIFCVAAIVLSSLKMGGVIHWEALENEYIGLSSLVPTIIILVVSLITIAMVRRAKAADSSKAWDVLFLILGILGGNIFYILGGIFGIVAVR